MISASLDLKVKVHKESGASLFLASPAMMQRCDNALYVEQYLSDNAPDWMAFVQDKFGIDVKARNKGLMLILGTMKTTRCVAMSFPQRPKRDVEGSGAISVANFIGGKLEVDSKSHQYSQFVSQNSAGDKPGGMGTPLVSPGTSTHPNSRAGSSGATRQSHNG